MIKTRFLAAFWLLLAGQGGAQPLTSSSGFLSPEQAFPVAVSWSHDQMRVEWDIQPGYALYRSHIAIEAQGPLPWKAAGTLQEDADVDPEFRQKYTGFLRISVPVGQVPPGREIRLSWQGCSLRGLCYPPQRAVVVRP